MNIFTVTFRPFVFFWRSFSSRTEVLEGDGPSTKTLTRIGHCARAALYAADKPRPLIFPISPLRPVATETLMA